MASFTLKSAQFRKERERSWQQLEHLINRVDKRGVGSLSAEELHRLPILYRGAVSSLSVARAISLDRALLDYLEAMVCRAFIFVYSSKRPAREVLAEFFTWRFPGAAFSYGKHLAVAVVLLAAGVLTAYSLVLADPERYYSFIPEGMAQGRTPAASTESLRSVLYDRPDRERVLTLFASFLFTHNAKVGILCFCLGFVAGVPVVILLFYNGLSLGAMAALYESRGLGSDFWAWVMGHGVTELGAVCLCAAAGLALASALVFPGGRTRIASLAFHGRRAAPIVIGAVLLFFLAALIEGFARQLVPSEAFRWFLTLATLLFWSWYFFWIGRRGAEKVRQTR